MPGRITAWAPCFLAPAHELPQETTQKEEPAGKMIEALESL
jgi:hypothetical protein